MNTNVSQYTSCSMHQPSVIPGVGYETETQRGANQLFVSKFRRGQIFLIDKYESK